MKCLFLAILLAASITTFAQKDTTTNEQVSVTDSTLLISFSDYQQFVNAMVLEMPAKYADAIRQWWDQRFRLRVQEYMNKPKKAGSK